MPNHGHELLSLLVSRLKTWPCFLVYETSDEDGDSVLNQLVPCGVGVDADNEIDTDDEERRSGFTGSSADFRCSQLVPSICFLEMRLLNFTFEKQHFDIFKLNI